MKDGSIDRNDEGGRMVENKAVAAFLRLPELVNRDQWLVSRGKYLTSECLIEIGGTPFFLSIELGRVRTLERGPQLMRPWCFAIRGSACGWMKLWQPIPEPGWHDIFALTKSGQFRIEGDIAPFMANLQYFKDLLAVPRQIIGEHADGC
jgi:hypothetical protein